jgi:hypothetical protein
MKVINDTPFATGAIAVKATPRAPGLSLIVKGTFTLAKDRAAQIAPEQQALCGDKYQGEASDGILHYEDDFAPFKPRADILIVGHGRRGEIASGSCRVGGQGAALASFGPVSRSTGDRAKLAGANGGDWFAHHWPRLADDCPWDYFNAAAPEMQVEGYLQGGEDIVLDKLHPRHDDFSARLPGLQVRCFLKQDGGDAAEVAMNLDTLWLDSASDTLVLVWRGLAEADPDLDTSILVVSERLNDTHKAEADYCDRLNDEEPAEEPAESEKAEDVLSAAGAAPDGLPPEIKQALDDPEAGMPVLAQQANLDDARFDNLGGGDGPADPNAGMDGVGTASGQPDAKAPTPLKEFFSGQDENGSDKPEDQDAGNGDAAGQEAEADADPSLLEGMSKKLAALGLSQSVQDTVVAPEGPSNAKAGSAGTMQLAGVEFDALAKDLQTLLQDEKLPESTAQSLEQIEPGAPPPAEAPSPELEEAIESGEVPDWPPQSAEDLTAIADLTAAFGADRPPRAEGTAFLSLLAAIAGEPAAGHSATTEGRES